jgi:phytoene/squalene synthetase
METQTCNYLDIYNGLNFSKIIDHPNILIAANFWEEDRFKAAKTCYKFMREIDDLIDDYKSEHIEIAENEKELFISKVNQWISSIMNQSYDNLFQKELIETFEKFRIPTWTMETFAKSMIYDIHNNGFSSLKNFLEYSRGASIAPASVFVHLCGVYKKNGRYSSPVYDVRSTATPCAIFSYLVHIIRDFQKDQVNNLNYFADDMILKHGLNRQELHDMAFGEKIKDGFRSMIKEYCQLADHYRLQTYMMIKEISPLLEPRYQLSLEIIFNLYLMVYERINIEEGNFTKEELNPTADEIRERVYRTICGFKEVEQRQYSLG